MTVLVILFSLLLWKHIDCYTYCQAIFRSVKLLLTFLQVI